MLQKVLLLPLLLLSICQWPVASCEPSERPLSQEPFLLDLFGSQKADQLTQLTSCLDSVFKLNQAYETMFSLKSIYNDYLSNKTDKLTEFEERLLSFCREALPVNGATNWFSHPVNAHKFVLFTAREMNPKLHQLINEDSSVKILLQHLLSSAECWLNEESVAESIKNLLVIKSFYNLSVDDFANGNFVGRKSESGFSTAELMELMLHLNRQFDPEQTVEFGEYLRRKRMDAVRSELGEQPVRSVYRILGKAYYQMKQFDKAIEVLSEYKSSAPLDADRRGVDADLAYIGANRRGLPSDFALESSQSATSLEREFGIMTNPADSSSLSMLAESREKFQNYRHICDPLTGGIGNGNDSELAAKAAKQSESQFLICENWRPFNGWYPIRKEILSRAPLIVLYSDVFNNASLTDSLLLEAEKRIFEAPKEKDLVENSINRLTQVRVHSFSKPMLPFDSNASKAIINRVEFVTRLDASLHFASQEKYIEVLNYGHGIRNKPHVAANLPEMSYNGMAEAFIFPAENVVGGEMVYPDIGLKITAKRSDLILQYSYLPTYHIDRNGAQPLVCPIVFGDKWVARIPLGLFACSIDQEVMLEPWLPGATLARRRSVARSWTTLVRPNSTELINSTLVANLTETASVKTNTEMENSTSMDANSEPRAQQQQQQQQTAHEDVKEASTSKEEVESTDADEKVDDDDDEAE